MDEVVGDLFVYYALVGPPSEYGSWGMLEYISQEPGVADADGLRSYKYKALLGG